MAAKHGNLSINSDNIFPIIKNEGIDFQRMRCDYEIEEIGNDGGMYPSG